MCSMNEKKKMLEIIEKVNKVSAFFIKLKTLYLLIFDKNYQKTNNSSVIIEKLDNILNYYKNRFKKSSDSYYEKIDKLYSIIYDELVEDEKIV